MALHVGLRMTSGLTLVAKIGEGLAVQSSSVPRGRVSPARVKPDIQYPACLLQNLICFDAYTGASQTSSGRARDNMHGGRTSPDMEAVGDSACVNGVLGVAGHGPIVNHPHDAACIHHCQQRLERMEAERHAGCRLCLDAQHLLRQCAD